MDSDIRSLLLELDFKLHESQIKQIFAQMVAAIEYCHRHNIVHRDVKLENFLINVSEDSEGEVNMQVKLCDFGLAFQYEPDKPPTKKCGSILAVAPEILTNDSYCHKVDIWALGIILHELLTTRLPFYNDVDNIYKINIIN